MKDLGQMTGMNSALAATHAERFMQNPAGVPESWRVFFETLSREELAGIVGWEAVAVWETRKQVRAGHDPSSNGASNGHSAAETARAWQMASQVKLDWTIREITQAYRRRGHLHAKINPLHANNALGLSMDVGKFGLAQEDLERQAFTGDLPLPDYAPVRDILGLLEATYCGAIGFEVEHIEREEERQWILHRLESQRSSMNLPTSMKHWILRKLSEAALLEEFLDKRFKGAKRFSIEGAESLIPLLHVLIQNGGDLGVREVVVGMAHRGRLNVMINIFHQKLQDLFSTFKDKGGELYVGGGDVKYHLGQSTDVVTQNGNPVHLSLCFNPSHLEFVNSVVLGRGRAKCDRAGDTTGKTLLPLLIHGDAAVIGQGIVAETINLAQLDGYACGGSVHIVINNQIGFTTLPSDSRSTTYCTDLSKMTQCPVLHVNAEDLDSVIFAAQFAIEYRQKFGRDVFIDLIAYRRHGHNEGDEPRFTQPQLYGIIDGKVSIRKMYRDSLMAAGELSPEQDQEIVDSWTSIMDKEHKIGVEKVPPQPEWMGGIWEGYTGGLETNVPDVETGYSKDKLQEFLRAGSNPPEGFSPHPKVSKFVLEPRGIMANEERELDWGAAEYLAFASLVHEGSPVRISGQDSQRGTFSHRHSLVRDPSTGEVWVPMSEVESKAGLYQAINSPLSEAGVLGFDYGYSLDRPEALTIWEAQFGDFVNGAQVILDQFITSGEDKWNRLSGLVLLLPHGFEGMGPEHSSARLERFLVAAAEHNMQICNPTTPAQIFHLLRRQVLRSWRKPLVIMSPKSLLRHRGATSTLSDLSEGAFQRIISDPDVTPENASKVILCSGRVYYDLIAERTKRERNDVAIVRIEQLYPLSDDVIREHLDPYTNSPVVWVQDEPWNMGAWLHLQARLRETFGRNFPINCVTRAQSASPATGSKASHKLEHAHLMDAAFGADPSAGVSFREV